MNRKSKLVSITDDNEMVVIQFELPPGATDIDARTYPESKDYNLDAEAKFKPVTLRAIARNLIALADQAERNKR